MNRLAGKTAFLAGATSGIGRAAAELFAAEGARVVVAGRRVVEGEEVVSGIRALGWEAIFIQTDVTEEASIASAIDRTVQHTDVWMFFSATRAARRARMVRSSMPRSKSSGAS